jgi:hypothetical protein
MGSTFGRILSGQRKVISMRTLTTSIRTLTKEELQEQINLCLWRLGAYLETGHWTYESSAQSLAEAEELLLQARKTAKRKIRCLGAMHPHRRQFTNRQWISYVLTAASLRFVLWLKDREYTDLQQQREDIELLLIEQIGKETKRLGFQLEL